jgi:hypothetical protein
MFEPSQLAYLLNEMVAKSDFAPQIDGAHRSLQQSIHATGLSNRSNRLRRTGTLLTVRSGKPAFDTSPDGFFFDITSG